MRVGAIAIVVLGALCASACGEDQAHPVTPIPVVSTAPLLAPIPPDPTCGGKLAPPKESPAPPIRTGAMVPLRSLVADAPALRVATKGKLIDLGDIRVVVRQEHPGGASVDVSRVRLPRDVPRAALPANVVPHWDAWYAAIDARHDALKLQAIAMPALEACKQCKERGCIAEAVETLRHSIESKKTTQRTEGEAVVLLLEPLAAAPTAAPGLLLAYGWMVESVARANENFEDLAPLLRKPIELYTRAAEATAATDPIGIAARYRRASALEEAHRDADALAVWRVIGAVDSPLRAEALYREGAIDPDPSAALAALVKARETDKADADGEGGIAFAATVRALEIAKIAGKPAAALEAAANLSRYPDVDGDSVPALALALDELGGVLPDALAGLAVPPQIFAAVGMLSAKAAEDRADRPRSERVWRAIAQNAPDTTEAKEAGSKLAIVSMPPLAEDLLRARLSALAVSCHPPLSDAKLELELHTVRSDIVVRSIKSADPAFVACVDARKKFYFESADPLPQWKSRVLIEIAQ